MRKHTAPQRTTEWYRHLSYRAITELEEMEDAERGDQADHDAIAGRGAAAWAIVGLMVVGAAIAGFTLYATVVMAAAH